MFMGTDRAILWDKEFNSVSNVRRKNMMDQLLQILYGETEHTQLC